MNPFKKTVIIRHRRENLKKCSLSGLETRSDICFLHYPRTEIYDFSGYFMLTMDVKYPLLSKNDNDLGLLILDATWKLAQKMEQQLPSLASLPKRSLPQSLKTAYPRRQEDCPDPEKGLASVEALAIAYYLLGRDCKGLLDHYYWKEPFLKLNLLPSSLF